MSLLEDDFRDLSLELAQVIRTEIDRMNKKAESTLKYIEEETGKKIERDIDNLQKKIIQNAEFEMNKTISDKINTINQEILARKTSFINKFIEDVKQEIFSERKTRKKEYFAFIAKKISEGSQYFSKGGLIQFGNEDLKQVKQNPKFLGDLPQNLTITQDAIPIDAGFIISATDKTFVFDYSINSIIEQNRDIISMVFMQIFPIFEVKIPDAVEIYSSLKTKAT